MTESRLDSFVFKHCFRVKTFSFSSAHQFSTAWNSFENSFAALSPWLYFWHRAWKARTIIKIKFSWTDAPHRGGPTPILLLPSEHVPDWRRLVEPAWSREAILETRTPLYRYPKCVLYFNAWFNAFKLYKFYASVFVTAAAAAAVCGAADRHPAGVPFLRQNGGDTLRRYYKCSQVSDLWTMHVHNALKTHLYHPP